MFKQFKKALHLFFYFFRIGWFTFGGGWSIVSQVQKDLVEKEHIFTSQDVLDTVSVAKSVPGMMIGNTAYLLGYQYAGVLGGVLSCFGIVIPPLVILIVLTFFYDRVRDNVYVSRALTGVRACVPAVIVSAVIKLHKAAFTRKICVAVALTVCLLMLIFKVSAVLMVLFGMVCGFLITMRDGGERA